VKRKWKIVIIVAVVLVAGIGVYASAVYSKRGVVSVQTGQVVRQDLTSVVTASGEIKPKNYINIGANAMGDITDLLVKEGDRVNKGQLLAKVEDVQQAADVEAQKANLSSAEADSSASEASVKAADEATKAADENLRTMQAALDKDQADLERMKADYDRGQALFNEKLLAKQDFDLKKFTYEAQQAAVRQSETRLVQARAQRDQTAAQREQVNAQLASSQKRVAVARANLVRFNDILHKHNSYAPLDGVVTNLPVRVGESVVPGLQNQTGTIIMTIADMSLITAEVKVDETDIVNIKLDQVADVTIDAIPNKTFKGHVTEIGNTAILRSTGVAASQSAISSQEAKDFKVVIALDNPPDEIRPGLSCTAKVTTATRQNVLTIPIQALTVRQKGQLLPKPKGSTAHAATKPDPATEKANKEEIQGVFVVANGKATFRKVDTGITGATDIEVLSGLKEGDQIITGTYQVIRTIANESQVKIDNRNPAQQQQKS
jgi:HlyD family secretion protein